MDDYKEKERRELIGNPEQSPAFSRGQSVRVLSIEIETAGRSRDYEGKTGIVEAVDGRDEVIWVKFLDGTIQWFNPWEIRPIKGV